MVTIEAGTISSKVRLYSRRKARPGQNCAIETQKKKKTLKSNKNFISHSVHSPSIPYNHPRTGS